MSEPYWILEDGKEKQVDEESWHKWFKAHWTNGTRVVKQDKAAEAWVSTVFLGHFLDAPMLFETQIVRDGEREIYDQYATIEEARSGHARIVARLKQEEQEKCHDSPTAAETK